MRWFKPNLRSSLHAIFSSSVPETAPTATMAYGIDDVRHAMLSLLTSALDEQFPHVVRRIRYATDIQALWFLRGDLMRALASGCGEAAAREQLEAVSDMFEDLLPTGLRSRPSPLSALRHDDAPLGARAGDSGFKPS
jgi:hypothetical protein